MKSKKIVAACLSAIILTTISTNTFAANIKSPAKKTPTTETSQTKKSTLSGAFTGSTPLVQYLYKAFSTSPSNLSVPLSNFTETDTQARFEELGQAAIEAYIQNGLTDFVEDFQYTYSDGDSKIVMTIIYANSDSTSRTQQNKQLDTAANAVIASLIKPSMTERQKAEVLSTYVIQNVKYDFDGFNKFKVGENVNDLQTSYSALIGKNSICQGYARAYKLLCDKVGVPCVVVFGKTIQFNTPHAWNRIYIDGKWETVDTTNPHLIINRIGSFCIPQATVTATLSSDGAKTFVHSQASKYAG